MPLYDNAEQLIRGNLAVVRRGDKPRSAVIGELTAAQLNEVNAQQKRRNLPEMDNKIVFIGLHLYDSRVVRAGYTVDQVICQIKSAMSDKSRLVRTFNRTVIENPIQRADGLGNRVNDKAVLECTSKFPSMELISVIPRGDKNRPLSDGRDPVKEVPSVEEVTNLPG
jgi:hypothetical protein